MHVVWVWGVVELNWVEAPWVCMSVKSDALGQGWAIVPGLHAKTGTEVGL